MHVALWGNVVWRGSVRLPNVPAPACPQVHRVQQQLIRCRRMKERFHLLALFKKTQPGEFVKVQKQRGVVSLAGLGSGQNKMQRKLVLRGIDGHLMRLLPSRDKTNNSMLNGGRCLWTHQVVTPNTEMLSHRPIK